ncbi:MAG: hypothetical protein DHS20C18_46290 [Saprospiraceae bacterium]|nr:MAG: hypothetical protein DHS20C18_46290 [Saprospiraceae bacterium]
MAKSTKKNQTPSDLYTLLIGINNYKNHALRGCENDVRQVRTYLESPVVKNQFGKIHSMELLNEKATKDKIVGAFKNHLGKAKKNDTVLVYFSGHGAREKTDLAIFQDEEVDSNIGGILCATFEGEDQANLYQHILSNKELRYLIRPLAMDETNATKSHVVAIFDCCNSGSNTRSVIREELPMNSRQVSLKALPSRTIDQFIFNENKDLMTKLKAQKLKLDEIMPQGDHVMLAACREVELAWERKIDETQRAGAFTTALIDVLKQHNGHISYYELYSRVLNRMKFSLSTGKGNKGQTPQVYVRTRNLSDRYNLFLTNQTNDQPSYGSVEFSEDDGEWRIDLGAFHGISADQKTSPTTVKVYPLKKEKEAVEVKVKKVFPFYATLDFSPQKLTPPYLGELKGLGITPTSVFLKGEKKDAETTQKILKSKLDASTGQLFKLVTKEEDADYVLHIEKGVFSITRPFDRARPVIKQIDYLDSQGAVNAKKVELVYIFLQQISRWSFLKDLERTSSQLPPSLVNKTTMYPVEFRLYRLNEADGSEKRVPSVPNDSNKFFFDPESVDKPVWLRIELVNHAPQILNCSLAMMTDDFGFLIPGAAKNLMKGPVMMLQKAGDEENRHIEKSKGSGPEALKGQLKEKYVRLKINKYHKDFNLQGENTFFKLIVSAKPLDAIETFHMPGLGFPEKETTRSKDGWGDAYQLEEPELPEVDWDIRTIEFYMTNRAYNPDQA